MSIIFPQDVIKAILDRLQDGTNGLIPILTQINIDRSQSTPIVQSRFITDTMTNQAIEVIVDYEEADIGDYFGSDFDQLRKTGTVSVTAFLRSGNREDLLKWASNYVEAITKSLHKYGLDELTSVFAINDVIAELYSIQREYTKFAGVRFRILINGGVE